MKRICYAGPAPRQLVVSDHKTIKMTIKIARNLKKSRQPYDDYDLSQLGMKKVADQGGGTKMVPNENTIAFLEAAEKKFNSIQIGPFQSTAQETDEKYDAAVTALNEATKTLPKKGKHEPWFAKGQAGIHDTHTKLVQCNEDLQKQGLTQQQRTILKKEKTRAEKTKTSDDQWSKEGLLRRHGD
jgi:hypothetical protein